MMFSRIGRSISRSSRSSLFNSSLGCDGYGARIAAIANQSGGIAPRTDEQGLGLGFRNAYFSSIGAGTGKQAFPSFSPVSNPNFANPSFARFFSSDVARKLDIEINGGKGEINDNQKNVLRPLSPHLFIYRPQSNSIMSILHRVSGMYLTGTCLLFSLVYMKMGSICFTYPSFYQAVFYSSKLHMLSLEIAALAFAYYVYHGIRHRSIDGVRNILADYVHHGVTRTWVLVLWRLFFIIVAKDSLLYLSGLY